MCTLMFSSLANLVGLFDASRIPVQILLPIYIYICVCVLKLCNFSHKKKKIERLNLLNYPRRSNQIRYNKEQIKSNLNKVSKKKEI